MSDVSVSITKLQGGEDLPYPEYATPGSSGVDLLACNSEEITITSGQVTLIPTGIAVAIPEGWEGQVRARSGLALKHGLTMVNGPGTIDSDYRGEIGVIITTVMHEPFTVKRGMRIAQLVICPVARVHFEAVDSLPDTRRGDGGFGHTGIGQEEA